MLIEAENLAYAYKVGWRATTVALQGTLQIANGQSVAVLGASGSGKTTLALMLAGLQRPHRGLVSFRGRNLYAGSREERKHLFTQLQMVAQHPQGAFDPRWTMAQSLLEPFRIHRMPDAQSRIKQLLAMVALGPEVLGKTPCQLSGGELQRLSIARALSLNPMLLILDEPTSMLDTLSQARLLNLLQEMRRDSGFAILLVTHDERIARRMCPVRYRIDNGCLCKDSIDESIAVTQ